MITQIFAKAKRAYCPDCRKGQSLIEYTIVIACIIAALLAMQSYVKRAFQGRLRSAADQIGDAYDPGKTSSNFVTTVERSVSSEIESEKEFSIGGQAGQGTLRTEIIHKDETKRSGREQIGAFGDSLWE